MGTAIERTLEEIQGLERRLTDKLDETTTSLRDVQLQQAQLLADTHAKATLAISATEDLRKDVNTIHREGRWWNSINSGLALLAGVLGIGGPNGVGR